MTNRRFEMYHYRQILVRMRLGDSDREIARSKTMGWLDAHGLDAAVVRRFAGDAALAPSLDVLMGVEGRRRRVISACGQRHGKSLGIFPDATAGRPRDPVNALLSLGYTLALNPLGQQAALRGLDLSQGFLHTPRSGRSALALDLLEPVRPWVDQWVWRLLGSGELKPADFTYGAEEGCRLGKSGRAVFYRRWHTTEDAWLPRPARHAMPIVLTHVRKTV